MEIEKVLETHYAHPLIHVSDFYTKHTDHTHAAETGVQWLPVPPALFSYEIGRNRKFP